MYIQGCHDQGKMIMKIYQGPRKSGNFVFSQGNFEKMKQVMEKSGDYKNFPKRLL